jgi:putative transposase
MKRHDHGANRRRRSVRLSGHDYGGDGTYFITVCTCNRACLFGEVYRGVVDLNEVGRIAASTWTEIIRHFPGLILDDWVVMPNHLHGIIALSGIENPCDDVAHLAWKARFRAMPQAAPSRLLARGPARKSLAAIVGSFKSAATRRINRIRGTPATPVWQRGYHEHIIDGLSALNRIRQYIAENPSRWSDGARDEPGSRTPVAVL